MFRMLIFADQSQIDVVELNTGKQTIGSSPTCHVKISHPEVNALAATVNISGSVVFVENKNEYPIFLGQQTVDPGGIAEWPAGEPVQLTRSISLELENSEEVTSVTLDDEVPKDKTLQNAIQIAVIVVCAVLSFYMLANDDKKTVSASGSEIQFDELVGKFEAMGGPDFSKLSSGHRTLLNYLTEARMIERRWGRQKSDEARSAYEMILRSRMVSEASESDPLSVETRAYASSRIASLR